MQPLADLTGQPPAFLWLAFAGAVVALLAVLVAALALRARWADAVALAARADAALDARFGRAWRLLRGRFRPGEWTGLALTLGAVLVAGGVWAFAEITEGWVGEATLYRLDRAVHAHTDALPAGLRAVLAALTHVADPPLLWVLTPLAAVVLWRRGHRWSAVALVLALAGGGLLVSFLKAVYARPRPLAGQAGAPGFSFPSGHAAGATLFYGFWAWYAWTHARPGARRALAVGVALALIVLVPVSRVVRGVHWVSDVLGGVVLGLAWLAFALVAARALAATYRRRKERVNGGGSGRRT